MIEKIEIEYPTTVRVLATVEKISYARIAQLFTELNLVENIDFVRSATRRISILENGGEKIRNRNKSISEALKGNQNKLGITAGSGAGKYNEYQKKWYDENKNAVLQKNKTYSKTHKSQKKVNDKRHYEKNKEVIKKRNLEYYHKHKQSDGEK